MNVHTIAKKMILWVVVVTFICVLASLVYYRSLAFLPFLFGAILGAGVSILKIFMLERAVTKSLTPEVSNPNAYITGQNLLRFALTAAALLAGALIDQISLWGVVAGVFSFQIAVYAANMMTKKDRAASPASPTSPASPAPNTDENSEPNAEPDINMNAEPDINMNVEPTIERNKESRTIREASGDTIRDEDDYVI